MPDVLVLGPQFRSPNIRDALARTGLSGPIVTITAGWQEREGELAALEGHLGHPVRDLRLYERAEAVFNQDAELHETHRLQAGRPAPAAGALPHPPVAREDRSARALCDRRRLGTDAQCPARRPVRDPAPRRRAPEGHRQDPRALGRTARRQDEAHARPPAGGAGAPGRKGRRRLPGRRARRGTVESAAPVRPGAAAAHTPRHRVVGRRDGDLGTHRAVPRPPAAGRRERGDFRSGARPRARHRVPAPRRVASRARRPRPRVAARTPAEPGGLSSRSTTAACCTGIAAGSSRARTRRD